jgi:hypothetical protein
MRNSRIENAPLRGLVKELVDGGNNFVKEEIRLVKTEPTEKATGFGRNAVRRAREHAVADLRARPVRWSAAAMSTGLTAGFFFKLKKLKPLPKGVALVARPA